MPVLRTVVEWKPDMFIYLGDNIYGDTRDMAELQSRYTTSSRIEPGLPGIACADARDRNLGRS